MYVVKKVAGTPNFAKAPAGSEVLFDGTTASAKANWVAEKPKLFQGLRATAHSVGSPPCSPP